MIIFEKDIIKNIMNTYEEKVNSSKIKKVRAYRMYSRDFWVDYEDRYDEENLLKNPYVYRHYYYTKSGEEITFYVGKGRGGRAYTFSSFSRGSGWAECTRDLKEFYIDVIDVFEYDSEAYDFEKELIGYYYLFKNECFGNGQIKAACIAMKEKMLSAQLSLFMERNTPIDEIFWFFKMLNHEYIYWADKYLKDEINRVLKDNKSKYLIHRIANNGKAYYMYK